MAHEKSDKYMTANVNDINRNEMLIKFSTDRIYTQITINTAMCY